MKIRAKYRGWCFECGEAVVVGDAVWWDPNEKGIVSHVGCRSVSVLTPLMAGVPVDRDQVFGMGLSISLDSPSVES
jgi:hypothetical protein